MGEREEERERGMEKEIFVLELHSLILSYCCIAPKHCVTLSSFTGRKVKVKKKYSNRVCKVEREAKTKVKMSGGRGRGKERKSAIQK